MLEALDLRERVQQELENSQEFRSSVVSALETLGTSLDASLVGVSPVAERLAKQAHLPSHHPGDAARVVLFDTVVITGANLRRVLEEPADQTPVAAIVAILDLSDPCSSALEITELGSFFDL